MKLREVLNSDITTLILRWRYSPLVMLVGWIGLHAELVYALVTGRMLWRLGSVEGRRAAPMLYWIYIAGLAGAVLFFDIIVVLAALHDRRERRANKSPETTRGTGL